MPLGDEVRYFQLTAVILGLGRDPIVRVENRVLPGIGFHVVLRHTLAIGVHDSKVELGVGVALCYSSGSRASGWAASHRFRDWPPRRRP